MSWTSMRRRRYTAMLIRSPSLRQWTSVGDSGEDMLNGPYYGDLQLAMGL